MKNALKRARILLPSRDVAPETWAVIACDQYTAQPEYWERVEKTVGGAPSALRLILPEIDLKNSAERVPQIHAAMRDYLSRGVLTQAVDGFVLVERTTSSGVRPGLMVCLDLEEYEYGAGAPSLIRATEGTVPSRVPPRARIRSGAPLELPHVMMLIDDPHGMVVETLYDHRSQMRPLYDFELMLGGGHLRGWAVENAEADSVFRAMNLLADTCNGLLYAVGDGNHSLAAAKQCWNQIKPTLTASEREIHPARFALVELVNMHCPALVFEPIHRILFNVDSTALLSEFRRWLREHGVADAPGDDLIAFDSAMRLTFGFDQYPLPLLQGFLDSYLIHHPEVEIDYIHGEDALRDLVASHPRSLAIMPRTFDKSELFASIRRWGALPRKSFSIGEAQEKRYYMEARVIQ